MSKKLDFFYNYLFVNNLSKKKFKDVNFIFPVKPPMLLV